MADIKDWDAFKRGRWCWSSFGYEGVFPRGIQFSDIDATVELGGKFLYIETKHWTGRGTPGPIPTGQRIMLQRRCDNTSWVYVLWGDATCDNPLRLLDMTTGKVSDWTALPLEQRRDELTAALYRFREWASGRHITSVA